jgi:hypothetical protein
MPDLSICQLGSRAGIPRRPSGSHTAFYDLALDVTNGSAIFPVLFRFSGKEHRSQYLDLADCKKGTCGMGDTKV